jgi:hypothetical protein
MSTPTSSSTKTTVAMTEADQSFFEDLERVAKSLSVVTDQASVDELRRFFGELQVQGGPGDVLRSDEELASGGGPAD